MGKTGYITARVEPELKAQAARVLAKVSVSTTDAITMFLTQVVLNDGLPFDVRVPNAETREAIAELESADRRAKLAQYTGLPKCLPTWCRVSGVEERLGDESPGPKHALQEGSEPGATAWLRSGKARRDSGKVADR
jgi:DNA-damage-inducible protein J